MKLLELAFDMALPIFAVVAGISALNDARLGIWTLGRTGRWAEFPSPWYLRLISALSGIFFVTFGIVKIVRLFRGRL